MNGIFISLDMSKIKQHLDKVHQRGKCHTRKSKTKNKRMATMCQRLGYKWGK